MYLSIHPGTHFPTDLPTYLPIYLSIYPSIHPSIHPPTHPSTHPPTYPPTYLFIYLLLYSPCGPWPLFQFLSLYRVSRTLWTGDKPVARPLPTHRATLTQNKCRQTSMPRVGFEPTIPVFERAKKFQPYTARSLWSAYNIYFSLNKNKSR
jgi:hypothetical protein